MELTAERTTTEQQAVATLDAYVDRLLAEYSAELNESANKRLAFFAFLFGGLSGLSVKEKLTPEQAHAVVLELLQSTLAISPMDSLRMAQFGSSAIAGGSPWSYAAHEGVDEFFAWQAAPEAFSARRLRLVLDRAPAAGV
jgi:hypothetical protein